MNDLKRDHCIGEALEKRATQLLEIGILYNEETTSGKLGCRFKVNPSIVLTNTFWILDRERCISTNIAQSQLEDPEFNLIEWYGTELLRRDLQDFHEVLSCSGYPRQPEQREGLHNNNVTSFVDLASVQVNCNKYHYLQRNAASVKGDMQILPKPVVIQVQVNGHPAWALVDSGSLGDVMSSTLADQLRVKRKTLDAPLRLQPAVQGSRSKINTTTEARLQYQGINSTRHFDIILGTP
jgi:Aspartyl protease